MATGGGSLAADEAASIATTQDLLSPAADGGLSSAADLPSAEADAANGQAGSGRGSPAGEPTQGARSNRAAGKTPLVAGSRVSAAFTAPPTPEPPVAEAASPQQSQAARQLHADAAVFTPRAAAAAAAAAAACAADVYDGSAADGPAGEAGAAPCSPPPSPCSPSAAPLGKPAGGPGPRGLAPGAPGPISAAASVGPSSSSGSLSHMGIFAPTSPASCANSAGVPLKQGVQCSISREWADLLLLPLRQRPCSWSARASCELNASPARPSVCSCAVPVQCRQRRCSRRWVCGLREIETAVAGSGSAAARCSTWRRDVTLQRHAWQPPFPAGAVLPHPASHAGSGDRCRRLQL